MLEVINKEYKSIADLQKINSHLEKQRKSMIITNEKEQKSYDSLTDEINKNNKAINAHNESIGRHQHKVGQYERAFNGIGVGVSKITGILGGLGVALSGVDIVENIIEVRKEFETYEATLKNTLGSESEAARSMQMIKDIASKTPFSVGQITDSYVKLVRRGFEPTREEIIKLGDLASFSAKPFDQLTEAILDAQTNGFERLNEFGIIAKQHGDKVEFTFNGVTKEVNKNADSIKNYILSLGDLQGVHGSMAAISATLEGSISNLQDSWQSLLNELGKSGSVITTSVITALNEFLKYLEQIVINSEPLKATFKELSSIYKDLYNNLSPILRSLGVFDEKGNSVNTTVKTLNFLLQAVTLQFKILPTILNFLIEKTSYLRDSLLSFLEKLGIVNSAIIDAIKTGDFWNKSLEKIGIFIRETTNKINLFGTSLFDLIQKYTFFNEIFGQNTKETIKNTKEVINNNEVKIALLATTNSIIKSIKDQIKTEDELNKLYQERYNILKDLGLLTDKQQLEHELNLLKKYRKDGLLNQKEYNIASEDLILEYNKKIYGKVEGGNKIIQSANNKLVDNTKQTSEKLNQMAKAVEVDIKKESFIKRLVDDKDTLNLIEEQLSASTNLYLDSLAKQKEARLDAKNNEIELSKERIQQLQSQLNIEIEAKNQGFANNYSNTLKEIELERSKQKVLIKEREKAAKEKEKIDKAQIISDSLQQISSLITASAKIWSSVAATGVASPVIAGSIIAAMWGSFLASKVKAYNQVSKNNDTKGYKDGVIGIKGAGTETSDSIPVKVSRGESIIKATATKASTNLLNFIQKGIITDNNISVNTDNSKIVELMSENNSQNREMLKRGSNKRKTIIKYI